VSRPPGAPRGNRNAVKHGAYARQAIPAQRPERGRGTGSPRDARSNEPPDLYDQALIDFGYGAGPGGKPGTGDNDLNPYAESRPGDPRPIPLAVPDFTDSNDWAYLADPEVAPIIQMAYADNPGGGTHPAPQLLAVISPTAGLMFTNDTMPIRVKDQWAYGVATYRGIGKRNVA
jgi:hypothetical protein